MREGFKGVGRVLAGESCAQQYSAACAGCQPSGWKVQGYRLRLSVLPGEFHAGCPLLCRGCIPYSLLTFAAAGDSMAFAQIIKKAKKRSPNPVSG
jgi:hypothetical protein